jgi:hypothetical protein
MLRTEITGPMVFLCPAHPETPAAALGGFILNSFVAAVQLLRSASQGAESETGFPPMY